jgi:hypothetical protein
LKEINVDEKLSALVERFLFGNGQQLSDYFVEQTPVSEMLCYRNAEGRLFDLPINDEALAAAVLIRLKELGVEITRIGY